MFIHFSGSGNYNVEDNYSGSGSNRNNSTANPSPDDEDFEGSANNNNNGSPEGSAWSSTTQYLDNSCFAVISTSVMCKYPKKTSHMMFLCEYCFERKSQKTCLITRVIKMERHAEAMHTLKIRPHYLGMMYSERWMHESKCTSLKKSSLFY